MNFHCDIQIQACANEGPHGLRGKVIPLGQSLTLTAMGKIKKSHDLSILKMPLSA